MPLDQPPPSSRTASSQRRRTRVLGAGLLCLGTIAVAVPAQAAPPVGSCPGRFELRAITDFNAGTQQFLTASIDRNGDGQVCAGPLPEAIPFLNISFTDNLAQL